MRPGTISRKIHQRGLISLLKMKLERRNTVSQQTCLLVSVSIAHDVGDRRSKIIGTTIVLTVVFMLAMIPVLIHLFPQQKPEE
jgi:hypothetical protein